MSVSDFEEMDADEFDALMSVYNEHEDMLRQDAWERARIIGALSVSPWAKGAVRPSKILPLPWDNMGRNATGAQRRAQSSKTRRDISKEEDKTRLQRLMARIKAASKNHKSED